MISDEELERHSVELDVEEAMEAIAAAFTTLTTVGLRLKVRYKSKDHGKSYAATIVAGPFSKKIKTKKIAEDFHADPDYQKSVNEIAQNCSEERKALLTETQETAARLNNLNTFMADPAFPKLPRKDKDLLYSQQRAMSKYVQILGKRLERAGQQFAPRVTSKAP